MDIKTHLVGYGYNLDYSYDDNALSITLCNYLGRSKYNKFWSSVQLFAAENRDGDVEQYIRDYHIKNPIALKLMISGQILISVLMLECIIRKVGKLPELSNIKSVLELGGGDGWAADYLQQSISTIQTIDVVDKNYDCINPNKNINIIQSSYTDFNSGKLYDMVFSIIGIKYSAIQELVDCIKRHSAPNAIVYIGLRIQSYEYKDFQKLMEINGFIPYGFDIERIVANLDVRSQTLPLFTFKKFC